MATTSQDSAASKGNGTATPKAGDNAPATPSAGRGRPRGSNTTAPPPEPIVTPAALRAHRATVGLASLRDSLRILGEKTTGSKAELLERLDAVLARQKGTSRAAREAAECARAAGEAVRIAREAGGSGLPQRKRGRPRKEPLEDSESEADGPAAKRGKGKGKGKGRGRGRPPKA